MLALIAGSGRLPVEVARAVEARGEPLQVFTIAGTEVALDRPVTAYPVEHLGGFLKRLKAEGVREVCFAGAFARTPVNPARLDLATLPLLPRMIAAHAKGDDGLFRETLAVFEARGFAVRAPQELAPDLLPPAGAFAGRPPRAAAADAAAGQRLLDTLSPLDIGQGCVIARGKVVAIEALPGTDFMLDGLAGHPMAGGGIFCKAPKRGQERRIDLPVIGPGTVTRAAAAGLAGIVIEAGGVMVVERDEVRRRAEADGVWIWVREREGAP